MKSKMFSLQTTFYLIASFQAFVAVFLFYLIVNPVDFFLLFLFRI